MEARLSNPNWQSEFGYHWIMTYPQQFSALNMAAREPFRGPWSKREPVPPPQPVSSQEFQAGWSSEQPSITPNQVRKRRARLSKRRRLQRYFRSLGQQEEQSQEGYQFLEQYAIEIGYGQGPGETQDPQPECPQWIYEVMENL